MHNNVYIMLDNLHKYDAFCARQLLTIVSLCADNGRFSYTVCPINKDYIVKKLILNILDKNERR